MMVSNGVGGVGLALGSSLLELCECSVGGLGLVLAWWWLPLGGGVEARWGLVVGGWGWGLWTQPGWVGGVVGWVGGDLASGGKVRKPLKFQKSLKSLKLHLNFSEF